MEIFMLQITENNVIRKVTASAECSNNLCGKRRLGSRHEPSWKQIRGWSRKTNGSSTLLIMLETSYIISEDRKAIESLKSTPLEMCQLVSGNGDWGDADRR